MAAVISFLYSLMWFLIIVSGIYTYSNSEKYDGKFKDGKRSGKVKF